MLFEFGQLVLRSYFRLFFGAKIEGHCNIPKEGAVILCINHMSNNDPLLIGSFSKRRVNFMAKAELFRVPLLGRVCRALGAIPTDRDSPGMSSYREALSVLKAGKVLGIFAQGRRFKSIEAKDAKSGVALFALRTGAAVVPVKITPGYRLFRRVTIKVGPVVDLSRFSAEKPRADVLRDTAGFIMSKIAEL